MMSRGRSYDVGYQWGFGHDGGVLVGEGMSGRGDRASKIGRVCLESSI